MLATMIALALANNRSPFGETPDPEGDMGFGDLTIESYNAGACPDGAHGAAIVTPAEVRLRWRVWNRDDEAYRFDVYLKDWDDQYALNGGWMPLSTTAVYDPFGGYFPTYEEGWLGVREGYAKHRLLGLVENGDYNRHQKNWLYRVDLIRIADSHVVHSLTAAWNKTYGTCS